MNVFTDAQAVSRGLHPSPLDVEAFTSLVTAGAPLEVENSALHQHLNEVIPKPWGHEFRVYMDAFYDVWKLAISPGQMTSTHCHPRNETVLLCLSGTAKVRLLNHTRIVHPGEHIHFHKGIFHSTENVGHDVLDLIEVEAPRNKLDLVRMRDKYGRAGTTYESDTLVSDVPPLVPVLEVAGASIRSHCGSSRFQFEVRSGEDLASAHAPTPLFAVDLGLRAAFAHVIHVVRGALQGVHPQSHYLLISRVP